MKETENIFSFDIWSYLKKSAGYTLRSPLLYPVELLRTSLRREAKNISVKISKERFEIEDDGKGIELENIKRISEIVDNSVPPEKRIETISLLRGDNGIGLIAVFAPEYKKINIENSNLRGRVRLILEKDEADIENTIEISRGTKIVIERNSGNFNEEIALFREYCRWVSIDITLNGVPLKKESSIPGTLVSLKMRNEDGKVAGFCGIPDSDEMCKVWLLHDGVVAEKRVIPPVKGFVFYAVMETGGNYNHFEPEQLIPGIKRLYSYIAKNYSSVGAIQKERIEKLLYFHYRETEKRDFIDDLNPFGLYGSKDKLNLQSVEKLASENRLYAVRKSKDINIRFGKKAKNVLSLTPNQSDFLINRLGINISFLDPLRSKMNLGVNLKKKIKLLRDRILCRISSLFSRDIDSDLLWNEEREMLSLLNRYFSKIGKSILLNHGYDSGEVRITKGLSLYPLFFKKGESGLIGKKLYICIGRRSLLIKKMTKLIELDNENIKIFIEYLRIEMERFLKL